MNEKAISLLRGARMFLQTVTEPIDWAARMLNNKHGYPPLRLRQQAGDLSDFEGSGGEYLAYLKLLCGLKPGDSLLDIGCGCSLMTLDTTGAPLLDYVGEYVGVDTNKKVIKWCQNHIKHQDCYFQHLDGKHLPLASSSFDVILVKSVFTHMLPVEVEVYLQWIKRLLRPSGHCLATFFLLNETSDVPTGRYTFRYQAGPVSYEREAKPRLAVAYEEDYLELLLIEAGFEFGVHYGTWSGRQDGLSFQDIIIIGRQE